MTFPNLAPQDTQAESAHPEKADKCPLLLPARPAIGKPLAINDEIVSDPALKDSIRVFYQTGSDGRRAVGIQRLQSGGKVTIEEFSKGQYAAAATIKGQPFNVTELSANRDLYLQFIKTGEPLLWRVGVEDCNKKSFEMTLRWAPEQKKPVLGLPEGRDAASQDNPRE